MVRVCCELIDDDMDEPRTHGLPSTAANDGVAVPFDEKICWEMDGDKRATTTRKQQPGARTTRLVLLPVKGATSKMGMSKMSIVFGILVITSFATNRLVFQIGPVLDERFPKVDAFFETHARAGGHDELVLQCPTSELSTFNYDRFSEGEYLNMTNQPDLESINATNDFRNHVFDGWLRTFAEVKESILDFKKRYYVPNLKSGDRIFESACGLGLNLYMTLEILQEEAGISNITVFGNEYLEANAIQANRVLEKVFKIQTETTDPTTQNHIGTICHGDSSDLSFVPANSFDLVFTGYLSPLWDPLEFNQNVLVKKEAGVDLTEAEMDRAMTRLCRLVGLGDPTATLMVATMQERQEEWFSNWFGQMIRIAKPGAPVIVEETAPPRCEKLLDWGGVSKDFWRNGIDKYRWDLNASTLAFGTRAKKYDNRRYHVFVRKNKATT